MHKRWKRRALALSLAALGLLWGCNSQNHTAAPAVWQQVDGDQVVAEPLQFPHILPDSGLVVEELQCYNGPYWEDGSGEIVDNVAGLMVYNPTDRLIEFASFALKQDSRRLYFFVYHLPPKSRCLVLEYNRIACDPSFVIACDELCVRWDQQEFSREYVDYVGLGPTMTIINRDARELRHVTVWYKQYIKTKDYYLGGAVYSAHVFYLQPGQQQTIWPEYYEAGCAKIVGIDLEL